MVPVTIEEARCNAGVTQAYMAEQMGVSRQTYAALEKAPDKMTIAQAKRICGILGRRYEEIIFSQMFSETST